MVPATTHAAAFATAAWALRPRHEEAIFSRFDGETTSEFPQQFSDWGAGAKQLRIAGDREKARAIQSTISSTLDR